MWFPGFLRRTKVRPTKLCPPHRLLSLERSVGTSTFLVSSSRQTPLPTVETMKAINGSTPIGLPTPRELIMTGLRESIPETPCGASSLAGAANYYTSAFLDRLPDEAIQDLANYHQGSADLPVQAEIHIHHFGGAVARVPAGSTAFTDRGSPFLLNCAARTPDTPDLPPHVEWARSARNAMANYGKGGTYVNFTGEGGSGNLRASYPPQIYSRLQAVKDQYDPFNLFRFNINIPPTKMPKR